MIKGIAGHRHIGPVTLIGKHRNDTEACDDIVVENHPGLSVVCVVVGEAITLVVGPSIVVEMVTRRLITVGRLQHEKLIVEHAIVEIGD